MCLSAIAFAKIKKIIYGISLRDVSPSEKFVDIEELKKIKTFEFVIPENTDIEHVFEEELYALSSSFYKRTSYYKSNNDNLLTRLGESYISEYTGESHFKWEKYYKLNKPLACLKKSLKINNTNPKTYKNLGMLFYYQKSYSIGLDFIKKGLEIFPDNLDLMNGLAIFYYEQNLFKESDDLYLKIIEKNPEYNNAYTNYAGNLFDRGLYETSIKYLKQNDPRGCFGLIDCYMRLKKYESVPNYIEKCQNICIEKINKYFFSIIYFNKKKHINVSKHYLLIVLKFIKSFVKFDEHCRQENINLINKSFISKFYEIKDFYQNLNT